MQYIGRKEALNWDAIINQSGFYLTEALTIPMAEKSRDKRPLFLTT